METWYCNVQQVSTILYVPVVIIYGVETWFCTVQDGGGVLQGLIESLVLSVYTIRTRCYFTGIHQDILFSVEYSSRVFKQILKPIFCHTWFSNFSLDCWQIEKYLFFNIFSADGNFEVTLATKATLHSTGKGNYRVSQKTREFRDNFYINF